jgi:type IV secretion system protein VirD4
MIKFVLVPILLLLVGVVIFTLLSAFLYATLGAYKFHYLSWWSGLVHGLDIPFLLVSGGAALLAALMPFIAYVQSLIVKRELYGSARFATSAEVKKSGLYKEGGHKILVGKNKKKYLYYQGDLHPFLAAPTGSGKGVGYVIPNLLNWTGSVVVTDMKKEAWNATSGYRHSVLKQPCHFFDPLNEKKKTCRINPFSYVRMGSDHVVGDIRTIADALVIDADGGEGNQWSAFARKLFTSITLLVLEAGTQLGWKKTIGQVYRIINSEDDLTKVITDAIKKAEEKRRLSDECKGALLAFVRQPEKQREGTITTLDGALQLWQSPLVDIATSASDVDFNTFRVTPQSLYLVSNNSDLRKLRSLFKLVFQTLITVNSMKTRQEDPTLKTPLLLLMDEFLSLGKMPHIVHAMSYVRGYGIRLAPVLQSPSQLVSVYGQADTDAFLENTDVRIVFRPKAESAKRISEMLGTETVKQKSFSKSRGSSKSVNTSDQSRALLLPQELRELGDEKCVIFVEKEKPIFADKIRYYQEKYFTKRLLNAAPLPEANLSGRAVSVLLDQDTQTLTENEVTCLVDELFDKYTQ